MASWYVAMNSSGIGQKMIVDESGSTRVYKGLDKLQEDIKFKILTPRGAITGNPSYGSDLRMLLFNPATKATLDMASTGVYDILAEFPGITVLDISSSYSDDKKTIIIKYSILYNANRIDSQLVINREV